ncbi:glutathione S-transferase family protein [Muricoccus radiodurans]|uniref:glutathione S-transferase family protein n=1 Tax=Muricoccus radiodurans TaxID=2231721 RepID=UPI003CE9DD7D
MVRWTAAGTGAILRDMLHFYGWATPNSQRVSIMLEELQISYAVTGVNIRRSEQSVPAILALNPYGRIPILVDDDPPLVLFESGAILLHLAEAHGRFLPASGPARAAALSWLMVALTSLGPMTGQAHHWTELAPVRPEEPRRHTTALVARAWRVLDARLRTAPFLGGDAYGIADIAAWPWIARGAWAEMTLDDHPGLARWYAGVGARPGVQRGMTIPKGAKLE